LKELIIKDIFKMRKLLVGGNWKANGSNKFVKDFSKNVLNTLKFD
jgi:hypothetical protein